MKDISNKERLLKIIEIFERETDENHELSFQDIIAKLQIEYGTEYEVGLKAIKDDIKTLIKSNYPLIENKDIFGKKFYSRQNRKFENYELRLLIDAVQSSRFLTLNESNKLINKIKSLTSIHQAKRLENNLYVDDYMVCEDSQLKYNIDKLHTAVYERKLVKFKYGRFNTNKTFIESNNGDYYQVGPYGLVWNNGFYYLVAKDDNKGKIVNYRVDRMRSVEILDIIFNREYFDLGEHIDRCFNMYPGEIGYIKIRFDNHLINAIIDRFGKDVTIELDGERNFILFTNAAINTGLVRWILNWGSDAEVIHPPSLIDKIKEEAEKMYQIYHK